MSGLTTARKHLSNSLACLDRGAPELPCRVDEMKPREFEIFKITAEMCGRNQFASAELAQAVHHLSSGEDRHVNEHGPDIVDESCPWCAPLVRSKAGEEEERRIIERAETKNPILALDTRETDPLAWLERHANLVADIALPLANLAIGGTLPQLLSQRLQDAVSGYELARREVMEHRPRKQRDAAARVRSYWEDAHLTGHADRGEGYQKDCPLCRKEADAELVTEVEKAVERGGKAGKVVAEAIFRGLHRFPVAEMIEGVPDGVKPVERCLERMHDVRLAGHAMLDQVDASTPEAALLHTQFEAALEQWDADDEDNASVLLAILLAAYDVRESILDVSSSMRMRDALMHFDFANAFESSPGQGATIASVDPDAPEVTCSGCGSTGPGLLSADVQVTHCSECPKISVVDLLDAESFPEMVTLRINLVVQAAEAVSENAHLLIDDRNALIAALIELYKAKMGTDWVEHRKRTVDLLKVADLTVTKLRGDDLPLARDLELTLSDFEIPHFGHHRFDDFLEAMR
jgi:hypothetical protein